MTRRACVTAVRLFWWLLCQTSPLPLVSISLMISGTQQKLQTAQLISSLISHVLHKISPSGVLDHKEICWHINHNLQTKMIVTFGVSDCRLPSRTHEHCVQGPVWASSCSCPHAHLNILCLTAFTELQETCTVWIALIKSKKKLRASSCYFRKLILYNRSFV